MDHKEGWVPKNWYFQIVMLEKTLESPLDCKEIKPVNPKGNQPWTRLDWCWSWSHWKDGHWKDWCWSWSSDPLSIWCEELTYWKRPWCQKRLRVGGEGRNRGWDGWMASSIQWTWVWANSRRWWRTGRSGVLQSMWSQRVRHDWVTEQ